MRTILSLCLALVATVAMVQLVAQSNTKDKQKQDKQTQEEESPFAKKKIQQTGASKSSKESSTLAFNGIDPNGKPSEASMSKTPSAADTEKAKKLSERIPKPEVLMAFVQQGGLKAQ